MKIIKLKSKRLYKPLGDQLKGQEEIIDEKITLEMLYVFIKQTPTLETLIDSFYECTCERSRHANVCVSVYIYAESVTRICIYVKWYLGHS